jgi:hypothetical protein
VSGVYLSYQRKDAEIATLIANALSAKGVPVWFDRLEINAGTDWVSAILDAIKQADVIVVLVSDLTSKSAWMERELLWAAELQKPIIPVKARPDVEVADAAIKYLLEGVRWYDLRNGPDELAVEVGKLVRRQSPPTDRPVPKNKGYAFISYCHEDYPFRDRLVRFLADNGYLYWEYGEGDRELEKLLALEIESKIIESTIVLSVVSEHWKQSMWCVKEFFFAKEVKRPVFLLRSETISPSLALAGETFIDFASGEAKGFEMLSRELKRRGL